MNTNITSGTIARTIILALALVNQLLSVTGHAVLPIEDAQVRRLSARSGRSWRLVWRGGRTIALRLLPSKLMRSERRRSDEHPSYCRSWGW